MRNWKFAKNICLCGGGGDGGDGGGDDDDAAADAAAEGVGGGTGVGGTATASEAAGGAIGGDIGTSIGDVSAAEAVASVDPSMGFGVPGVDPGVGAVDPGMSAGDLGFGPEDVGAVTGGTGLGVTEQSPEVQALAQSFQSPAPALGQPGVTQTFGPQPDIFSNVVDKGMQQLLAFNVAKGLGSISSAIGLSDNDQSAADAVAAQEATAADAGAGDIAPYNLLGGQQAPLGGGLAPTSTTGGLPATPTYLPPPRVDIPPELLPFLSSGMSDVQLRAAIATGALGNANPVYRSQNVQDFYNNLLQQTLINKQGGFQQDLGDVLPIEMQYLLQSRGVSNFQPTGESLLGALGLSEGLPVATGQQLQRMQPGTTEEELAALTAPRPV